MRTYARLISLGASLGALACGGAPVAPAQADSRPSDVARECPRALALDAAAIEPEVVCWLQRYVQIDTTNPPGGELAAARFLAQVLERDGIRAEVIESAPGRANLLARLPGKGSGKALMLMHHMDVVPAVADEWSVPPFSATLRDGFLWGRGSLDNKGIGIAQLVSVLLMKRLGVMPERDVLLLALADEESGGGLGARWLTEQRPELFADVEFVLNEGGGVLELGAGHVAYVVELAQKAPLWLRVTARGPAGHASSPTPDAAASVLVRALARLADHRFPMLVLPEVQALFAARAEQAPEPLRAGYRDLASALEKPAFREQFMKNPRDAGLVQNTLAISMLSASPKENVISERASAVLDIRLLPGQDPEVVTAELSKIMAEPALELERILSWQARTSPRDTALFAAIERLARRRDPGAPVTPNVIGSFTDCNAVRAVGVTCYGFIPMRITLDDVGRIHGKDERIRITSLSQAVIDLSSLIAELGGGASPGGR